jgi:hypothetical protein
MLATFQNSASVLSIGVFFSLMIVGLSAGLPHALHQGLVAHGVPGADATRISHLPPVASLFAAFLGYNPMQTLLGPHVLQSLPAVQQHALTGRSFFPSLISPPFHTALIYAFAFAIAACLIAAIASALRGGKYHHRQQEEPLTIDPGSGAEAALAASSNGGRLSGAYQRSTARAARPGASPSSGGARSPARRSRRP